MRYVTDVTAYVDVSKFKTRSSSLTQGKVLSAGSRSITPHTEKKTSKSHVTLTTDLEI